MSIKRWFLGRDIMCKYLINTIISYDVENRGIKTSILFL